MDTGTTTIVHRVYGYVAEKTFYAMLNEAKAQNLHTSEEGRVDIGALVNELVTAFAEGRYTLTKKPIPKIEVKHVGGVDYVAERIAQAAR